MDAPKPAQVRAPAGKSEAAQAAEQGSQGSSAESSFCSSEKLQNLQESLWSCRQADDVPRVPGLQGRAFLQTGKVTLPPGTSSASPRTQTILR